MIKYICLYDIHTHTSRINTHEYIHMIKFISLCNIHTHTHTSRINTHEYIHIKYMSLCNMYTHIYTHKRLEWPSRAFGGLSDVGDDLMGRLDALSLAGGNM